MSRSNFHKNSKKQNIKPWLCDQVGRLPYLHTRHYAAPRNHVEMKFIEMEGKSYHGSGKSTEQNDVHIKSHFKN